MILTHQQIIKRGLTESNLKSHLLIMDIRKFQTDIEEQGLKLSFEILAKMKAYQKMNVFFKRVRSEFELEISHLNPILEFLMNGTALTEDHIRQFFELEKRVFQFEGNLNDLCKFDEWDFTLHIHAAIFGVPFSIFSTLEYSDDRDLHFAYDQFGDIVVDYLDDKISYEDLIQKTKEPLFQMVKE